ncbi:MAG TPA: DNA lyase [Bacteroidota bacterium]|nr:DNA lyase [Bacteroidota bacterium]
MTRSRYRALPELRSAYDLRREPIRARLQEFASVRTDDLFYELAYCILTPQSSAANADSAVQALHERGFREQGFDPTSILRRPGSYIRFHNTKAQRLLDVREQFADITRRLDAARREHGAEPTDSRAARQWLATTVRGLGMKEASHFLRNIGFRNLAILDRHILRNLHYHGVLRSVPATLTTGRYLTIEEQFRAFADQIGIPMDELDLLFWSKETGEIRK